MPTLVCHKCANDIVLDLVTYWNYRGSITCRECKNKMNAVISNGQLLESQPFIDPRFFEGLHTGIPLQPLEDYREAVLCVAHRLFKASAVMTRRALQGALLKKEVQDTKLSAMIEYAFKKGMLTAENKHLATTVTFFGNEGAHPRDKEINRVGELEATQGLHVTKKLLLGLFSPPKPYVLSRRRPLRRSQALF